MSQSFNTTIGLSANSSSAGQPVDFDAAVVSNVAITNTSGADVQYTLDGATWVTVANGATALPNVLRPSSFRLRKSTGDSYPVAVAVSWRAGSALSALTSAVRTPVAHPALYPVAVAVAPTLATSGPGGPSPITTNNFYDYNTAAVQLVGAVPTVWNALSVDYYANLAAGVGGSGTTPCAVEFGLYGDDFAIQFRNGIANSSYFWVWATDPDTGVMRPQTAAPVASTANSVNSKHYYRVTFGSVAERIVRVYYCGADFGGIYTSKTASIFPIAKPARSLCIVGDSYATGTGATSPLQAWGVTLGRLLGVETFINAVGGTGFAKGATTNSYTASARVTAALACGATDYLLCGSINDSSESTASVRAAAESLVAQIKAARPDARLWFTGVQMLPLAYNTGTNIANNTALKELAASVANGFIDEIGESWFSGTGRSGATANDGNRDLFCGTDSTHPTQAGHDFYAGRRYSKLLQAGW